MLAYHGKQDAWCEARRMQVRPARRHRLFAGERGQNLVLPGPRPDIGVPPNRRSAQVVTGCPVDLVRKVSTQASATVLMAAKVVPMPFLAQSLRLAISCGAVSPNIFSKKAKPSGGSSHVSVTSVPPSTAPKE